MHREGEINHNAKTHKNKSLYFPIGGKEKRKNRKKELVFSGSQPSNMFIF